MTQQQTEEFGSALSKALTLLGDMWTLRIVMWVFNGSRRFQDLRGKLSISDPVLSRRLSSLVAEDILVMKKYQSNPPRSEYFLSERGLDLWQVLVAMWIWDRRWAGPLHRDTHTSLRHHSCGHLTRPVFGCGACGAIGVSIRDLRGEVDPKLHLDTTQQRSRRSPSMTVPIDATGVLGDRWSTLLLSDAFTGTRRFNDFQTNLGISPVTLAQRLKLFVDGDLMLRQEIKDGKRLEYRLSAKGQDFADVTTAINYWAETWLAEDGHSGLLLRHVPCENRVIPQYTCNACNEVLKRTDIRFEGPISDL